MARFVVIGSLDVNGGDPGCVERTASYMRVFGSVEGWCPNPHAAQGSTVLSGRPSPHSLYSFPCMPSSFNIREGKANAIEVNSLSLM